MGFPAKDEDETTRIDPAKKKSDLIEWIFENCQSFGRGLEIVTDQSGLGKQFGLGFGGIGALLWWGFDFAFLNSVREKMEQTREFEEHTDSDRDFAVSDQAKRQ